MNINPALISDRGETLFASRLLSTVAELLVIGLVNGYCYQIFMTRLLMFRALGSEAATLDDFILSTGP